MYIETLERKPEIEFDAVERSYEILSGSFGEERATSILQSASGHFFFFSPFRFLRTNYKEAIRVLSNESPQVIAIALCSVHPCIMSEILLCLPPDVQGEVIRKIRRMPETLNIDIVQSVAKDVRGKCCKSMIDEDSLVWDTTYIVGKFLMDADPKDRFTVLDFLESEMKCDEDAFISYFFRFEDATLLKDGDLQSIINHIDRELLPYALFNASIEVMGKFRHNMSSRMFEMIGDEIRYLGEVNMEHVRCAKFNITRTIFVMREYMNISVPWEFLRAKIIGEYRKNAIGY